MNNGNLHEDREFHIDELNDELYYDLENQHLQKRRRKIHEREIRVKKKFSDDDYDVETLLKKQKKKRLPESLFKKIFFFSLFVFLIAAFSVFLSLYHKKTSLSQELIAMKILGPPFIDGGDELDLHVQVQNFNEQTLEDPDLVLSYKKDPQSPEDDVVLRRSLPQLKKGDFTDEKYQINLFGKEGDVRKIHATLEYRVAGSNSVFFKKTSYEVVIRSSPVRIEITGPKEVVQDQEIELKLDLAANTHKDLQNILVDIDYPLGFEFEDADKKPSFKNHIWYIPVLRSDHYSFKIKGKISGFSNEEQSFHVRVGKQNPQKKEEIETNLAEVVHTVLIKSSFIRPKILLNGKGDTRIAIKGGNDVDVEIQYENTSGKTLNDVEIRARLMGNLFNDREIQSLNGEYDSFHKTIIWDKTSVPSLKSLADGDSGSVSFTLPTKALVSDTDVLLKPSASVLVDVSASGENGKRYEAEAVAHGEILANSDLSLVANTFYKEGPFENHGPIPPKVEKATTYTLTFQVNNSSNPISNAFMKTTLPSYVRWLGKVYPSSEKDHLSYDENTREIVWRIGNISPKTGVAMNEPRELSLQVRFLPSQSHLNVLPKLTRDIILEGDDQFTKTHLRYKKNPLTTRLSDSGSRANDSRVVES